ncbi:MAG: MoaD/ThiS family protein [Planctomycetota bacterium]|jgi:sulfur carrier protein ThiS
MPTATGIRVTAFGTGRFQYEPKDQRATVGDALRTNGVETEGRRVAVNGHPANLDADVLVGDEVTVVPRVQGG